MKEMICIACPMGCHLTVDEENLKVKGNLCPRGKVYGIKEVTNPTRIICSTVIIKGGIHHRLPVKTNGEIPKEKIMEAMKTLDHIEVKSPIQVGDVIVKDILGTGVDFVATRDM